MTRPRTPNFSAYVRPARPPGRPVTRGWYQVLVRDGAVRETSTGRRLIALDMEIVRPYEAHGLRLFDVIVPHSGQIGEVQRQRAAGYGLPQFIIDDYMGGGLLPIGNEAGLALVAAELVGRTAWVMVRPREDPVRGKIRHEIMIVTQREPEAEEAAE